jgi:large subunit ribosomal protein L22
MKVQALSKAVRISPSKAIPVARLLKGLPIERALTIMTFNRTKAAALIRKTLKSAVANVEHNAKLSAEDFRVESVRVELGPVMKRFWARSRGMVRPVKKATSHIRVILAND